MSRPVPLPGGSETAAGIAPGTLVGGRFVIERHVGSDALGETLLAREDSMMAWKQQKAVCDLDALTECPEKITAETPPCCPKAPLTTAEQASDAEARKLIDAELATPTTLEDEGKGKRKGKRKGR